MCSSYECFVYMRPVLENRLKHKLQKKKNKIEKHYFERTKNIILDFFRFYFRSELVRKYIRPAYGSYDILTHVHLFFICLNVSYPK